MYLEKLEIQGFKSFAKKTVFEFMPPKAGNRGVTAIVGPNGSGKSNVSDAIRWVMGEQSLKLIRGKKSADVIFAGSEQKSRLGFAEVTLTLNNEDGTITVPDGADDGADIFEYSQITIARRIYRSGESNYLINGHTVRLADVQLLLARAHFAEKSYTVIGQGMIDHMLMATPAERKIFFDEAVGIKEFQIKRHRSVLKLHSTRENLHETKMLLAEIEPRLRSLTRQIKRLEKREVVEEQLHTAYLEYYGKQWFDIEDQYVGLTKQHGEAKLQMDGLQKQYDEAFARMQTMEVQETKSDTYAQLQAESEKIYAKRSKVREEILRLKNAVEMAKVKAESQAKWTPLPLSKIIMELETVKEEIAAAETAAELTAVKRLVKALSKRVHGLIGRLQKPAPEQHQTSFHDEKAVAQIEEMEKVLVILETEAREIKHRMDGFAKEEEKKKSAFFALQRELQQHQSALHTAERRQSDLAVQLARVETRRQTILEEIDREVPQKRIEILNQNPEKLGQVNVTESQTEVYRLRRQLELIGGIDEEVVAEYEQTKERFEFLDTQVTDLDKAITSIEKAINDLDEHMTKQRKEGFRAINREFDRYFKMLFGGGKAGIEEIKAEKKPAKKNNDELEDLEDVDALEEELNDAAKEELAGIDIYANPPGKRINDINVLSGGERAMASAALLCAILSLNPSPFVVLDEVDAALDESNSIRLAQIIEELAEKAQFIIITHNRATMEVADVLYGITMGDDGVSGMLSVKLEEAKAQAAR